MTRSMFPNFTYDILNELSGIESIIQFPRNPVDGSIDFVVRVEHDHGKEWVGNFIGIDKRYFSGVLAWPGADQICVVARGNAFVVRTDNPDDFYELPVVPIIDARNIDLPRCVIFATFWDISAFGEKGKLWSTQNLAMDGLKITKITNESIVGVSNNYDGDQPWEIDLQTGKIK